MRAIANFTLLRYFAAHVRMPAPTSSIVSSDSAVLMILKAAELTQMEYRSKVSELPDLLIHARFMSLSNLMNTCLKKSSTCGPYFLLLSSVYLGVYREACSTTSRLTDL